MSRGVRPSAAIAAVVDPLTTTGGASGATAATPSPSPTIPTPTPTAASALALVPRTVRVPRAGERRLAHKRDAPDVRDYAYSTHRTRWGSVMHGGMARATSADLRGGGIAPVSDQGAFGSCTAFALTTALALLLRWPSADFVPSTMAQYNNTRMLEGTALAEDDGATMRGACKAAVRFRIPSATAFGYTRANLTKEPPLTAFRDGLVQTWAPSGQRVVYVRLSDVGATRLTQIKDSLSNGWPVVFGFLVYDSFYTIGASGVVPLPDTVSEKVHGGHAQVIVAFNDATSRFTIQNSWGAAWGDHGFAHYPYAFISNASLVFDVWSLQLAAA